MVNPIVSFEYGFTFGMADAPTVFKIIVVVWRLRDEGRFGDSGIFD